MTRLLFLLVACSVCGASASRAEPLSRAQAVARALEANPQVLKSLQDVALYRGRVQEAMADALPDVSLMANALRYRDPSLLNSSSFDAFPPELRQSLRPIGANLFDGAAQVRQTVYSFKLGGAIRAARLATTLGQEQLRGSRQAIALEAVRAYNEYLLAHARVRVAENSASQKEKHLEMARNRRAAGVATELDVLRAQVDLENSRTLLLRQKGGAELARGRLNAVMVRPIDTPIEPTDALTYEPLEATLDEVIREAEANRPEALGAALSERIHGELVGVARGEGLPRLDFQAAWGFSVRQPGNFLEKDFAKWNAALTLTFPVFDGRRSAGRVAQARAEEAKAAQDSIALLNRIRLEAKEAVDRLNVARSVLSSAELNVSQAEKALAMTQANYRAGAATTLEVVDAQSALTLAESLRVEALYEHANARAAVHYVMARDPLEDPRGSGAAPAPRQEGDR
ncbi:MAG TPA: TolC family protein [Vicinamibacteria bacterium]|nr:TolC family protein [Vicinamibacteria bacterium]